MTDNLPWVPTSWWRVLDKDGELWAETSNEREARWMIEVHPAYTLERLYSATVREWRAP